MTVDTVGKVVVESDKCGGLDMTSYQDLNSSPNVGVNRNGNNELGHGDGKDDYVFVNGSDVVSEEDDHVDNRESVEASEGKLCVQDPGIEAKLGVENDEEAGEGKLSVENHEIEEAVDAQLSVDNHENEDIKLSVENQVNEEVNQGKSSMERNDNVEVNGRKESDELENGIKVDAEGLKAENEVNAEEENGSGVGGGGVMEAKEEIKSENQVVAAESGGSESTVKGEVDLTARDLEVNERSNPELVVDDVKEISDPQPVVDLVKDVGSMSETPDNGTLSVDSLGPGSLDVDGNSNIEGEVDVSAKVPEVNGGNDQKLAVDEVNEGCAQELVVDQVEESNVPKADVDQVKIIESVSEADDNGAPSAGSNGPHSLDVDANKNSVFDAQELTEVQAEDTIVNGVPEAVEPSMKEISDPEPVVEQAKDVESGFEVADAGSRSVDSIQPRSLDVDGTGENNVSDAKESAEVNAEDTTDASGVPDALGTSVKETSDSKPVVDQVTESSDPEPVVEQAKDNGSVFQGDNNDTPSVNSIGSRSLDVDDNIKKSVSVPQESAEVEAEDRIGVDSVLDAPDSSVVEVQVDTVSLEVPEGEFVVPHEDRTVIPESEQERLEDNGDVHGADVLIAETEPESKPLETDDHKSVENGVPEAKSLNGDVQASAPLDSEDKGLPLDNATSAELSSDYQHHNLPSGNVKDEKHDLIESEANIDKQTDVAVDPVADGGNQEPVDLEARATEVELDQADIIHQIGSGIAVKPEETPDSESVVNQSNGAPNQDNPQLAFPVMENPVSVTVGQSDDSKIKSTATVEENSGAAIADMQFDITDKSALNDEPEWVYADEESEVAAETGGTQEALPEQGALQDEVAEQTETLDVVDKEISSEDFISEKTLKLEDTTNMSKLESADHTAIDGEQNDQGGSLAHDNVFENKVVPSADESSEDAGSGLISEDKTVNSEVNAAAKSNNVSDGTIAHISFGSFGCVSPFSPNDIMSASDVLNKSTAVISTVNGEELLKSPANDEHSDRLNNGQVVAQPEQINEVAQSSVEGSEAGSSDGQNTNHDLVRSPFYWLVKVPKLDDGKFKEQLSEIETELAEKTKSRDVFQAEFNKQQGHCRELKSIRESANSELKAARELMWAKSREVDAAHNLINLARHGITTEDIDKKVLNLERTLQHQTLNNLREEKEMVREIKQLNLQRQKLLANPQRQQEVQQAQSQRGQTEEQLKVLKKELEALRDNHSKADERFKAAKKKHEDETALLDDLRRQLRSADDIRQEAYTRLITLKKQLNDKNSLFYKAKNDLRVAYNYATAGNMDGLERHCVNQVEKIMEMWNKNDEFRKEYIQCNMRRVLWKFGTSDGTRLGIDEAPPSLGDFPDNRVNTKAKVNPAARVLTVERELAVEVKPTEEKLIKKVEQKKAPPAKMNEAISENSVPKVSNIIEIEEKTEEPKLTKEEEELARKAEQSRREEEAARLKEQLRLEEKAKAEEALERKRRNALKAQARAEIKARKEAEEKEKERERRANKKQKKRGSNLENSENATVQPSEHLVESAKEPEVTEKPSSMAKRPQKAALHSKQIKTTKPIPPALRNKGKRGFLRYWPYACVVLLAIALFYLGSFERIQTIKQHISALLHW